MALHVKNPVRVTWFGLFSHLRLKKIPSGYLDDTVVHLSPGGSHVLHDDNAPLHKAQVVTECFEWHANAVSPMPICLL